MPDRRLPLLLALLLAGCGAVPERKTVTVDLTPEAAPLPMQLDRIAMQAEAWPTPGDGGTPGIADRLTDGQKAARLFVTAAGTRAPWTFVFKLRGSHAPPVALLLETPKGAGCRPSDLSLFGNSSRSTLDRSGFTRFIEASARVGFAELRGEGGHYLLRLPAGADPGYLWFRVMQTADGSPPCISEVTALASLPDANPALTEVSLQTVDTTPFQGKNYMGFPGRDGSGEQAEGSAAPPPEPVAEGSGLVLPEAAESAFETKARPATGSRTPSSKPR